MIAQLKAMIGMDSRQYVAGARRVQSQTQRMRQSFRRIASAIGVTFSVAAIINFARHITQASSEVVHAARNVGILTGQMDMLDNIARETGNNTRELQNMIGRLEQKLWDAAKNGGSFADQLEKMNINIADMFGPGMDPAQRLEVFAREALSSADSAMILNETFGRMSINARAALEQIAIGGRDVNLELGAVKDEIEALGTRWEMLKKRAADATATMVMGLGDLMHGEPYGTSLERGTQRRLQQQQDAMIRAETEARNMILDMQDEKDRERARAVTDQIDKEVRARKTGLDKMKSDLITFIRETRDQMETAGEREKAALEELIRHRWRMYDKDVENLKQAEREKLAELQKTMQERMIATDQIRGTAPTLSGMEQMGAAFGGERTAALRTADRQLQVAQEQLRIQQEFSGKIDEVKERLDNIVRER
jgi:hypothetical protein